MQLVDLHADTITALYDQIHLDKSQHRDKLIVSAVADHSESIAKQHPFLLASDLQVDINKLKSAHSLAQFFVIWLNLLECEKEGVTPWDKFIILYEFLQTQVEAISDRLELVTDMDELNLATKNNKIAGFVAIEEGACISSLFNLEAAHMMGVRYITLVWNYETHIGVPGCIDQTRGLKPFGFEMVEYMQHLGMLIDVSHLSDQGVRDVLSHSFVPAVIASHSNSRTVCDHTRNLPDDLITAIANKGGVIGVGCVPNFLDSKTKTIKIDNMVKHIRHIYNIAGIDVISLGNDFDGYVCHTPKADEIKDISDIQKLKHALLKDGFSQGEVEKIFYKNALRIIERL